MEKVLAFMIPLILLLLLIRVILLPMKWFWKLLINSACGFACLLLVNCVAPYTGLVIPINLVTAAVAGFLGLPGIGVLALVQMLL